MTQLFMLLVESLAEVQTRQPPPLQPSS